MLFSVDVVTSHHGDRRRHLKILSTSRSPVRSDGEQGTRVRQTAYIVNRVHKLAALGLVLDVESPNLCLHLLPHSPRGGRTHGEACWPGVPRPSATRRNATGGAGARHEEDSRGIGRLVGRHPTWPPAASTSSIFHVFNYDVPSASDPTVHRIGRVGRAGRKAWPSLWLNHASIGCLRNIEQLTKQKIEIAALPTMADLRAKRLELTRAALQAALRMETWNSTAWS